MYVIFFAAGLYATQFTFQSTLALLVAILAAFAAVDAAVLARIHRLEIAPIHTDGDLRSTRRQLERLSRMVLVSGTGLGAAFLVVFVWMMLRP